MKLVSRFPAVIDAESASELLEQKGIATFISSKRSNALGGLFTGAFRVGLWVVLDNQYQDACQLLVDKNHKVANTLSRSEIVQLKQFVQAKDMSGVLKVLFQLLLLAVLFAVGVAILVYD